MGKSKKVIDILDQEKGTAIGGFVIFPDNKTPLLRHPDNTKPWAVPPNTSTVGNEVAVGLSLY
ncbi:hypothetical protein [Candidatus Ichthyocystis sparus]|uniref:hypothetical protein n=1 Tax=Candidatus Ichthyocystis sparus TaxID=1561004 RepID=UPI000B84028B|nr:hypothetical protein [Candidatus Ichthyocystis sparus]